MLTNAHLFDEAERKASPLGSSIARLPWLRVRVEREHGRHSWHDADCVHIFTGVRS